MSVRIGNVAIGWNEQKMNAVRGIVIDITDAGFIIEHRWFNSRLNRWMTTKGTFKNAEAVLA